MDAALVTRMFNFGASANNTLNQDVFKNKDKNFEDFFSKSLEKEKGIQKEKENINIIASSSERTILLRPATIITDFGPKQIAATRLLFPSTL